MAKKITVTYIDDIDESVAATQTVAFSLDGATYEIDLSDSNAALLRDTFSKWVSRGRRMGRASARSRTHQLERAQDTPPEAIRQWARSKGYDVPQRGRLSASLIDAYRRATS